MAMKKRKAPEGADAPLLKQPRADVVAEDANAKQGQVDPTAVFIKGLPEGAADADLRRWIESKAGPTVTCYRIRNDYGLAKFKDEADARRCLEELKDAQFQGSAISFESAKPKRRSSQPQQRSLGSTAPAPSEKGSGKGSGDADAKQPREKDGLDMRDVLLKDLPAGLKKDALRAWIEGLLPGGCGIDDLREAPAGEAGRGTRFVVKFRREANARRAVETLQNAELQGQKVSASFRVLDMSRKSAKGGRLIVRNLAFGALEKHVRKEFAKMGELTEVHLPLKTGASGSSPQHRGFAFVQFSDPAAAEKAVSELNGVKICGRGVAVDWAMDSKLYGTLLKEEERPQKAKKEEKAEAIVEKAATSEEDSEEEEEEEEEEEDKGSGSDEDDDEEEEEEDAEEKQAADEIRRMKKMLGEDDAEVTTAKAKKKGQDEKPKEDRAPRDVGFDVGEGRTLFVRNCPFDATDPELRKLFGKYGKIASVKFVADRTGQNEHSGSVFIKYHEADGLQKALAVENDADRKLKELSSVIKRSEHRDMAAVEGFGVALRGRRLVLKQALAPGEVGKEGAKAEKGKAAKEASSWLHLLHVGEINENNEAWANLSKSEKSQRAASMKERKFRINNPNFAIHPLRLSVRNLPRIVDATKVREVLIGHLAEQSFLSDGGNRKERRRKAQELVQKVSLVRDTERKAPAGAERRSKGFGFMTFKDHRSAMAALEHVNDNPDLFGGGKRPIVEFAIEDKRKLRMQEELYARHAHKLLPKDGQGKDNGDKAGGDGEGDAPKKKHKHKKKNKDKDKDNTADKPLSRGQRQRENRRKAKVLAAEKEVKQEAFQAKMSQQRHEKKAQVMEKAKNLRKRKKAFEPDVGHTAKKMRSQRPGEMSDDFELRAMERFRSGKR